MENTFQTSFIPKKPIVPNSQTGRRSLPIGMFPVFATILLVLTILASIGFFLYKNFLIKQKNDLSESLILIKDSFDEGVIKDLEFFEKRIIATKDVLGSHYVLSPMFILLGELTIPSIQYKEFSHSTDDTGFSVSINGVSRDYMSIALQADVFNETKGQYFKNVVFSNLVKNEDNEITFDLNFNVDPSILSFEKNILLNQDKKKTDSDLLSDNPSTN